MSCGDLVTTISALRQQAGFNPVFGAVSRFLSRTRQIRLAWPNGCHMLFRGVSAETIDYDYPVGVSFTGSPITEQLTARDCRDGDLVYSVRAYGPGGVVDDADPVETVTLTFADDIVQHPAPQPPIQFKVEPYKNGQVKVTAEVNNAGAVVPAVSVVVFTDSGLGGGVDWETTVATYASLGGGFNNAVMVFDPELVHGTNIEVGVRTRSQYDVDSTNTDTQTVQVDSVGPAAIPLTVTEVCDE